MWSGRGQLYLAHEVLRAVAGIWFLLLFASLFEWQARGLRIEAFGCGPN